MFSVRARASGSLNGTQKLPEQKAELKNSAISAQTLRHHAKTSKVRVLTRYKK